MSHYEICSNEPVIRSKETIFLQEIDEAVHHEIQLVAQLSQATLTPSLSVSLPNHRHFPQSKNIDGCIREQKSPH